MFDVRCTYWPICWPTVWRKRWMLVYRAAFVVARMVKTYVSAHAGLIGFVTAPFNLSRWRSCHNCTVLVADASISVCTTILRTRFDLLRSRLLSAYNLQDRSNATRPVCTCANVADYFTIIFADWSASVVEQLVNQCFDHLSEQAEGVKSLT